MWQVCADLHDKETAAVTAGMGDRRTSGMAMRGSVATGHARASTVAGHMRHSIFPRRNPLTERSKAARQQSAERLVLPPGASQRLYTMHVNTPLNLRLWVEGDKFEEANLHGWTAVVRPDRPCEQQMLWYVCSEPPPDLSLIRWPSVAGVLLSAARVHPCCHSTLHPREDNSPGTSPRTIILRLILSVSAEGTCSLTFIAPHWLVNLCSLPLRVYNARGESQHSHILEAGPQSETPMLFSLTTDTLGSASPSSSSVERVYEANFKAAAGSARLGVAPIRDHDHDYGTYGYSEHTPHLDMGQSRRGKLSKPFSVDATGYDGCLELQCDDATIAELSVSIEGSKDALANAGSTIVVVRDRFIIRNDTVRGAECTTAHNRARPREAHAPLPDWHACSYMLIHAPLPDWRSLAVFTTPRRLGATCLRAGD
jgi:hypothetical protein